MSGIAIKQMNCPSCGTGLSQFNASAQTLVCPTCGSYVAIGSGEPEVSGKTRKLPKSPVPITLGKTVAIEGAEYAVLGRVMYMGWDDEDRWEWNEWMLGAEDGRMLWLSYDENGFSIFTKKRLREQFDARNSSVLTMGELRIPIRENYPAKIVGAEGELTWRAQENERLHMAEGAQAGKRYSVQQTDEEIEVYEGRAVDEEKLAAAFGDETWLAAIAQRKQRRGNRQLIASLCILFAIGALALAMVASALGEQVQQTSVPLRSDGTASTIPVAFDSAGRPSVVSLQLNGTLNTNTYLDVDVGIVAPDNTESYLFTKSFWHETGYDDEGAWTDIQSRGNGIFVPLSAGEHRLTVTVDPTSTFRGDISAQVTIRRNIVMAQWLVGYAVVIGIVGVIYWFSANGASSKES